MITIALDLSTKPGYALFKDRKRLASGTSFPKRDLSKINLDYPHNYLKYVQEIVDLLLERVNFQLSSSKVHPHAVKNVVIEETTASSQNYSQKKLEFIHYEFLKQATGLYVNAKFSYIRDGVWKNVCEARMTDVDKKHNAKFARLAKKRKKEEGVSRVISVTDRQGNKLRKVDPKYVYIRRANELFGLNLTKDDEDQAAALLIGLGYLLGAPVCDGTITGGVKKK